MLEDKHIRNDGDIRIIDYSCRHLEASDYEKMQRLIDRMKKEEIPRDLKGELLKINSPAEFMVFYSMVVDEKYQKKIRSITNKMRNALSKDSPLTLPDEELFTEMKKNIILEGILDMHCQLGGEIWCQGYPSPDNPGWTRVELK